VCCQLNPDEAEELRSEVMGVLRSASNPKPNLTKQESQALSELKDIRSIMVLKADKGRATVVLDKTEYEEKVQHMLDDERTYVKLKKDPTAVYKSKLVSILTRLKHNKISQELYSHLYPTSEKVPQLYCLPKVHKAGIPFRPIVDYIGSIGYNTSRFLADILAPMVGKTEQFVKNSQHLAENLAGLHLETNEMLISHDVVSLFTNTKVVESLEVIRDRLERDKTWRYETLLEVNDVMELLELILTTTYFIFRGQIYRQKFGTAMGSPVFPLVANLYMEHLEQKLLATAPMELKPRLWKRYVDDILEVVNKTSVDELIEFLNNMDNSGSIKFTHEKECEGKIPFLDVLIVRNDEGNVKLQIYRKPTHTDQYLNFSSHNPIEHKLSVVRTLLQRSQSLITDSHDRQLEDAHVDKALRSCGYPDWTFRKVKDQMRHYWKMTERKQKSEQKVDALSCDHMWKAHQKGCLV